MVRRQLKMTTTTSIVFTLLSTTVFRVHGYGYRDFGEECIPIRTYIQPSQQGYRYPGVGVNPGSADYRLQQQQQQSQYQPQAPVQNFQQPYPQTVDEINSCKSEKGLRCDEYTRKCRCNDLAGATWVFDHYRCELPVDNFCTTQLDYANHCVEGAECTCNWESWDRRRWVRCDQQQRQQLNPLQQQQPGFSSGSNGRCKCRLGYRAYDDNSACWYSGVSRGQGSSMLLALGILINVLFLKCSIY
jgi:hypothetical protein